MHAIDQPMHDALGIRREIIQNPPKSLAQFVPPGYAIVDTSGGDLNLDEYRDMIIVLQKNEDTLIGNDDKPVRRPLLILLGEPCGRYKLAARNDNAILSYDRDGKFDDLFTGITVRNGYFSIEHGLAAGDHWDWVVTFRFNSEKQDWLEYKDGFVDWKFNPSNDDTAEALVKDNEIQKTVKDFGIVPFGQFDIDKANK